MTAPASLSDLLYRPRSVAVVGASGRTGVLSARPLALLRRHGFAGDIYPVNPRYDEINGLRCYPSLEAIGAPVDLVLSMVPAADSIGVVEDAGRAGARAVIVFASGFAETGPRGAELQHELVAAGRRHGVRVLGPNCQGVIHVPSGLFATFTPAAEREMKGSSGVAYVGQSGAVGGSVLDLANDMGLSLTAWAATGNQADLDLVEIATALVDDPAINVILMYAEGIADGAEFVQLADRARSADKRLVVLRSGRSAVGKKAAASHTGAMLGDDLSLILTAKEYGVILVDDVDEMLAVGALLASGHRMAGRRLGIVTTSGGAGILLADHCDLHEITVPELTEPTKKLLTPYIPDFGAIANPVDVTAQILSGPNAVVDFLEVCRVTAEDPNVDGLAIVLTMVVGERAGVLAKAITSLLATVDKPVWILWLAGTGQTQAGREVYRDAGMPVFSSAGSLARTLGHIAPSEQSDRMTTEADPGLADLLLQIAAGDAEPSTLLSALGIRQPESVLVTDAAAASEAAAVIGRPVAMKIKADAILHKSDIGGVRLGVPADAAAQAFEDITRAAAEHGATEIDGVEVQEMVPSGAELIIGATSTADGYPSLITVGFGGITTEIYQDVESAIAPITEEQAVQMLRRLKGWPLLDGFRGRPKADVAAAAKAAAAVSRMAAALSEHRVEFEINPLIVAERGAGAVAVDLLVTVDQRPPYLDEYADDAGSAESPDLPDSEESSDSAESPDQAVTEQ